MLGEACRYKVGVQCCGGGVGSCTHTRDTFSVCPSCMVPMGVVAASKSACFIHFGTTWFMKTMFNMAGACFFAWSEVMLSSFSNFVKACGTSSTGQQLCAPR